jgi:hypothetical protein
VRRCLWSEVARPVTPEVAGPLFARQFGSKIGARKAPSSGFSSLPNDDEEFHGGGGNAWIAPNPLPGSVKD